jgi:hypothetical protein
VKRFLLGEFLAISRCIRLGLILPRVQPRLPAAGRSCGLRGFRIPAILRFCRVVDITRPAARARHRFGKDSPEGLDKQG